MKAQKATAFLTFNVWLRICPKAGDQKERKKKESGPYLKVSSCLPASLTVPGINMLQHSTNKYDTYA